MNRETTPPVDVLMAASLYLKEWHWLARRTALH